MKRIYLLFSLLVSFNSFSSVQLSATRIIFNEGSREASVVAKNLGGDSVLLQNWISDDFNGAAPPFAVTPGVNVLPAEKQQILRIFYDKGPLPSDRESVFRLNVQEVPRQASGNHLQLAVVQSIKLFYRPKSILSKSANEAPSQLSLEVDGTRLTVNNPSAYYINLSEILQGSSSWNADMIPPQSSKVFSIANYTSTKQLTLKIINDYGVGKAWNFKESGNGRLSLMNFE